MSISGYRRPKVSDVRRWNRTETTPISSILRVVETLGNKLSLSFWWEERPGDTGEGRDGRGRHLQSGYPRRPVSPGAGPRGLGYIGVRRVVRESSRTHNSGVTDETPGGLKE